MAKSSDIVWHEQAVERSAREKQLGQKGVVIWFTGLSGCGKSTVANELDRLLNQRGCSTMLLDGDNIRHGLCSPPDRLNEEHGAEFASRFGLGFAEMDRQENIRRVGEVAALFRSAGVITLTAFVSPYRIDRDRVRRLVNRDGQSSDFLEVFMDTPLSICEQRDPKGLYKKARAGEIKNFTGISDPYEAPESPELRLDGAQGASPSDLACEVLEMLEQRGVVY